MDVKVGDRIRLVYTNDIYTKLVPGNEGVVTRVSTEPENRLDVAWGDGSTLSLLPDEGDQFQVLGT